MNYKNQDKIAQVRQYLDIVSVISSYVNLKKSGKNYKGLCPFHKEKTPSFMVNPESQFFHCFGCGIAGDVFKFVMLKEGITFKEAVQLLAERAGVEFTWDSESPQDALYRQEKENLLKIHQEAMHFFQYCLNNTKEGLAARQYLNKRGLNEKIISYFKIGYAPDAWDALLSALQKKGYSLSNLSKSGLIMKRSNNNGYYDRFRKRIIFPIFDIIGRTIGFGGRVVDDSFPKYLNSPETSIFHKSQQLYGLNFAKESIRQKNYVIIFEGYMDVISAVQFGINNCVASLGTSLTKEQAKLLRNYAELVYIAYDGDSAGQSATQRGLDILRESGCEVKVISFPDKMDPDEFLHKYGKEAFEDLFLQALPLTEYKLELIYQKYDLKSVEGKSRAVKEVFKVLGDLSETVEIDGYLQKIAGKLSINEHIIRDEFRKFFNKKDMLRNKQHINDAENRNNNLVINIIGSQEQVGLYKAERSLLSSLLHGQCSIELINEIDADEFYIKEHGEIFKTFLDLTKEGNIPSSDELIQALCNDKAKNIVFQIYAEGNNSAFGEEVTRGYLKKIRLSLLNDKIAVIDKSIREAEENNDFALVKKLLDQRQQALQIKKNMENS